MVDVVLVRWPEERGDVERLTDTGAALLYLVAGDVEPPRPTGCLEDWLRVPADERDLRARVGALELRAAAHAETPWVADDGVLHHGDRTTWLPPAQTRLARLLTARFTSVVPDAELIDRGSPEVTDFGALRTEMARLRAHLRPMGLFVRRVTSRGYRLQSR
jgi:DNA-binding response OmpR family regulator